MSEYPSWITPLDEQERPAVEVDWVALSDDWRERDYRWLYTDENRVACANRVRAMVAGGLAPASALAFADQLDRRGAGG